MKKVIIPADGVQSANFKMIRLQKGVSLLPEVSVCITVDSEMTCLLHVNFSDRRESIDLSPENLVSLSQNVRVNADIKAADILNPHHIVEHLIADVYNLCCDRRDSGFEIYLVAAQGENFLVEDISVLVDNETASRFLKF